MFNQNQWLRCVPWALCASAGATLVACGGGSGSPDLPAFNPPLPFVSVTSVAAQASLSYSKLATLNVVGTNFDASTTLLAPGCTGLAELAGSTATLKRYTAVKGRLNGEVQEP